MVSNLNTQAVFKVEERLTVEEKAIPKEIEVLEYSNLVSRMERKTLPLETKGKYIFVKFRDYGVPDSVSENFYEAQLLGYIPIIENAELNIDFKRNPQKLFALVSKGALVQIDEASITGKKGKAIRKFALKLCKHRLVHIISPNTNRLAEKHVLSERVKQYVQKKVSPDYVTYLEANAKHIAEGTYFHTASPIQFRKN